ncbi:hypothetical protein ACQR3W_21745 [Rhodococcus ruber]|uniref:Uncharacterized protein n=1 Tax=Rhodococcus ruber TaxID=1830 RepID=A0A098BMN8_9NOCA|nr:hypothetical protein [Rhodococcus ruber]MCZ4533361.1 hypothetical protein [Rhodococcus ruber]MCZ4533388.1 hypothetical protein [Rhodococcus ruber]CDZ88981.1 hypothetical protein RHRU231_450148 [Rhodococcus ruber]
MTDLTFTLEEDTPQAWRDLIGALVKLSKYPSDCVSPFHCEHDTLTVNSDPGCFSSDELAELEKLGFFAGSEYDDQAFTSFRFGSA